jgi:hypothetical protein
MLVCCLLLVGASSGRSGQVSTGVTTLRLSVRPKLHNAGVVAPHSIVLTNHKTCISSGTCYQQPVDAIPARPVLPAARPQQFIQAVTLPNVKHMHSSHYVLKKHRLLPAALSDIDQQFQPWRRVGPITHMER